MLHTKADAAWMHWLGTAAILLAVLFTAYEGNEWMRQLVIERSTPANLQLPPAACPEDELEEEGLSVAECEQMVSDVVSYVVSAPRWFSAVQAWLAAIGTGLGIAATVVGVMLANYRAGVTTAGTFIFAALAAIAAGHFVAAQLAGPIVRAIHLPVALLWFSIHLAFAVAFFVARRHDVAALPENSSPKAYGRFDIAVHWFLAISIFFLFVSSWWMLALPLPSDAMTYREFPFQLHKNLGITIALLMVVMVVNRIRSGQALAIIERETPMMRRLRLAGHISLYVLVFAVCITGYMSSSYSGWGTTWWWLIDLPYWGREDEELNQFYSDLHLWTCWGLLIAMAAHIGAALMHAFRHDGLMRRIVRW